MQEKLSDLEKENKKLEGEILKTVIAVSIVAAIVNSQNENISAAAPKIFSVMSESISNAKEQADKREVERMAREKRDRQADNRTRVHRERADRDILRSSKIAKEPKEPKEPKEREPVEIGRKK